MGKSVPADSVSVGDIDRSEINSDAKRTETVEENGNKTTEVLPESATMPSNLAEFNTRLTEQLKYPSKFSVGTCFSIGKPGSSKYAIYRVQSLGDANMKVWGGTNERPAEEISYSELFKGILIEKNQFKILENKLGGIEDLLAIMQSHSTQHEAWKKVEVTKDGKGIDFVDRRFDYNKVKKQYLPGNEGHIIEIISIENGIVRGRIGEKFEQVG